jgi:HSP20 family protein
MTSFANFMNADIDRRMIGTCLASEDCDGGNQSCGFGTIDGDKSMRCLLAIGRQDMMGMALALLGFSPSARTLEVELERNHLFLVRHGAQPVIGAQIGEGLIWQPAVDVYRCDEGWLIKFELAGVRQEDVRLEATSCGIRVSGVRRDVRHFDWQEAHLMEIAYTGFERSVQLPEPINDTQLIVDFRDGMMYVRALAASESG